MKFETPFLFCEPPPEHPGAGFILSTSPPFFIGRVLKMLPHELEIFNKKSQPYEWAKIEGFCVVIVESGTLQELAELKTDKRILLIEMADFYFQTKVKSKIGAFKRYRDQ